MNRRSFLLGSAGLLAAPSIVRVASIMPVSVPRLYVPDFHGLLPALEPLPDMRAIVFAMADIMAVPREWLTIQVYLERVPSPAK